MKFAIWILVILALTSLMSMFIVEFFPIDINFPDWEKVYSDRYGSGFPLMKFLHLSDPYRSWWYQLLLGTLALSLALCIIDQAPRLWRRIFRKSVHLKVEGIRRYANSTSFLIPESRLTEIPEILKPYRTTVTRRGDERSYLAHTGKFGYAGPWFTHLGLLLLVIGGFIAIWGVSTRGVGAAGDIIESDKFDFKVRVDDFRIEYYPLGVGQWVLVDGKSYGKIVKKLPGDKFKVSFFFHDEEQIREYESTRLKNKFDIDSDRGNIKDYISDLTIIDQGVEIASKRVEVNKPMRYKGFRFYQSSFDTRTTKTTAGFDSAEVLIIDFTGGAVIDSVYLAIGQPYPLPNGSILKLQNFLPHFNIGEEGPVSASASMRNPAVNAMVENEKGEEIYHQWLFLLHDFHGSQQGIAYSFRLTDLQNPWAEAKFRTVLEIKENEGYEVIWLGLILASLGVFLSFYQNPRHIWAIALKKDDEYELVIGGYSPKEKEHFKLEFEKLINNLKQ